MSKNKRILLIIIFIITLLLIPSMCQASNTFTTIDGIEVKKVVDGFGGNIELRISNIKLNEEYNYIWGIGKNSNYLDVDEWYALGDFNQANKSAVITLASTGKIGKILRGTNNIWLYIKDDTNKNFVIESLKIDATLPLLKTFNIIENPNNTTFRSFSIDTVYDIDNLYYNIQKITDEKIIEDYRNAKISGKDLSTITSLATINDVPANGWNIMDESYTAINNFYIHSKPTNLGIYYVWIKGKDNDSKMVYGYNIFGLDSESPTVSSIKVVSPASGTYKTAQTVKIRVNFNEIITGTSVPKLKIKFGDSAEREVVNGIIKDNYLEYSYNIQDSDVGQLMIVDLVGGTIKDVYNNNAILSCKINSGYIIKANVEGTSNNQTENLDKEINVQDQSTIISLSSIAITKGPAKINYVEGEKFDKSGMVVTAIYSNGSEKEIINYTILPLEELKIEDKQIEISYTENGVTKIVDQKITVTSKDNKETVVLDSIKIVEEPTKINYIEGEKFNKSGMNVIAIYSDGTTKQITNYMISSSGELKRTDNKIDVQYTENGVSKTAQQIITVSKDTTIKSANKLPQTGATLLILVVTCFIGIMIVSKVKYGKYKDL